MAVARLGLTDGDDAAVGLAFFRAHGDVYVAAGLGIVAMAVALTVAVIGLDEALAERASRVARRSVAACGFFAAACLAAAGAVQVGAPGPVLRIAEIDAADGRAAYLVVHLVGVQGAYAAGLLAVSGWVVGICVLAGRSRLLPAPLVWLGVIPAVRVLIGLFGPLLDGAPDALFVLYLAGAVGVNLWVLIAGAVLARAAHGRTVRPGSLGPGG
ncbi:DUF4386 family protein [Pengzhenrongella sicca]|uniref:DUF4386 family protein n=1 Tax=Pengzhenrongella sicca TaxID=2819238 RepID=A0A8A4ZLT2_9MICO|nr:DUF4386 family protein [Pengzhenrongella sicca]QTE31457.1 DUF4386 family protein [Pengzhenrongella sicca]